MNDRHRDDKTGKSARDGQVGGTRGWGEDWPETNSISSDVNRVKAYPFSISKLSSLSEIKDCKEFRFSW